jgi:acyl-CoA hydrolase
MNGDWQRDARTPAQAVALVTSGMRVFVHGVAATPTPLLEALSAREYIADVTLYHMHTSGPAPFAEPEMAGRLRSVSLFTGSAHGRPSKKAGRILCPSSFRTSPISSRLDASASTPR